MRTQNQSKKNEFNLEDEQKDKQERDQWVLWRTEKRNGEATKVPYEAGSRRRADSTDPSTWSTFSKALYFLEEEDHFYDGVGFVFSEDGPFAGVDLDGCRRQGELSDEAVDITEELESYTEVSPSGSGLHIICRASLSGRRRRTKEIPGMEGIEVYDKTRFFTITGWTASNCPTTVEPRQDELDQIYNRAFRKNPTTQTDPATTTKNGCGASSPTNGSPEDSSELSDELLRKNTVQMMLGSENREKIRALLKGDTSGYPSHSEADFALCNHLAYWTEGKREEMDEIFRLSGLYREKWERETYREPTLVKALENINQIEEGSPSAKEQAEYLVRQAESGQADTTDVFKNIEVLARLSKREYAPVKAQLKDALGDLNMNDLRDARKDAKRDLKRENLGDEDLPTITLGTSQSRVVVDKALEAFQKRNEPPRIFSRGGEKVHITKDDRGEIQIEELSTGKLDAEVHRAANFIRSTSDGPKPATFPQRYLSRMRAQMSPPILRDIVQTPRLREDGTILNTKGYDPQSRLYFNPDEDLQLPRIQTDPSKEEIENAKNWLWEPLQDFPFNNEASKANALALILTPIIRPALGDGCVPLALVDASTSGAGKTLLVQVASIIATGSIASSVTAPTRTAEWRKQITSKARKGDGFFFLDNVRGVLESRPLEEAITTPRWEGRVLGQSKMMDVPLQMTWIATGNNLQVGGDLDRRFYKIRLVPQHPNPEERSQDEFEHPNLKKWTRQNRGKLIGALLTLARGWYAAGEPDPSIDLFNSFTEWSRVIGGILEHAEIDGFLANWKEAKEDANDEEKRWMNFLEVLHDHFHGKYENNERGRPSFKTKEVVDLLDQAEMGSQAGIKIKQSVPVEIRKKMIYNQPISRSLGKLFRSNMDTKYGTKGWRIEKCGSHQNANLWTVVHDEME
jgi:primase-polymerase (primpol)-like protein